MKILILNYEYPPLGGGAGIVTQHLANEFVSKGHDVTILTTWFSGEPEYHSQNNLTIIRLKAKRKFSYQSNPLEMYDWMKKANAFCSFQFKQQQFDICLANFSLPGGYVANRLWQTIKLPYVVLSHGHDIPWFSTKQMFFWHLICYPLIKKILFQSSYNIILTPMLKKTADSFTGLKKADKNIIISNGLLPLTLRKGFDAGDKIINALFVGRLVDQKDPLTLIKAFFLLQERNVPVHLKIIGDGILKQDLETFIAQHKLINVELLGKISQSQVIKEYEKSHILISPSREEAMSLAVLEAVSCGVYVFVTNVSANKEIILDNVNGNLVEYNNEDNIADKVNFFYHEKFLKNYQYPDLMLQFMQHKYSWELIADKYLELFQEAININNNK